MPQPKVTRFTSFEFSPEELYAATRFSQMNLMLIQTLAADVLEEKTRLKIDLKSNKPLAEANIEFMQQEAALQGRIEAYEHLLMLPNETTLEQPQSYPTT
jgi:hypothetical protein